MEATGYRYTVGRVIRLSLAEVERLEQFVLIGPDGKSKADMLDTVRAWKAMFTVANLRHPIDEHEFAASADELHYLASVLPEQTNDKTVDELRGALIDSYQDVMGELQRRNHLEPFEKNQPWYIQPLRQIAEQIWWNCKVVVSPQDGLVTVYADGFSQIKCKFRPRMGNQTNLFEVVGNRWGGKEQAAWVDWRKGSVHTLAEFIKAMNSTRSIANGKLDTWDDDNKCFIPTPQGEDFVPNQDLN